MKFDEKVLEEKIVGYREESKSCAESTLRGLCEITDFSISSDEITTLSAGFAGGIGGTFDEGTCGALTGALLANGLILDEPNKIKSNAKELFTSFKEEYGTVTCGKMTNNGEDKSPCIECCVFIAKELVDLFDE